MKKNAWEKYDEGKIKEIFSFCDGYKEFISKCKTERECVKETINMIEKIGYVDLNECIQNHRKLQPGDKIYVNNYGKAIALFVIGSEPLEQGMKILGAHIDSPRIDLKQVPMYEDTELALLDTHYYGGIKKYQWVATPLAIHGVVCKTDGSVIEVVVGENDDDPVLEISDLLVHLSADQMSKPASKVIDGENLNVLVGSIPLKGEEKEKVKANILKILKEKYNFDEDDFMSAELELVPAGKARDLGFDRSMIMGYGHDDRICAYTSLKAIMEIEKVDRTCCCLLVDKEEVGSNGNTGMQSKFFENAVAEIMNLTDSYNELKMRRCLANSVMLSSDVSAAFDPNYSSVYEKKNSAYFGRGIVFNKYTGSRGKSGCNDANPEYIAKLRSIMDKHDVSYQTAELGAVDMGGGGTIAYILANLNMQVIDCGVPVHNMHAPYEVACKVDIYETKKGYYAFLVEA